MSDIVIRVENLTKEYRLGVISHGTLRQDLQSWWARMRGEEDPNSLISTVQPSTFNSENPHLLAIDDVSFDVKRGEILGIIGRNGAGKSTLLKILSRVTAPSKGTVKIKGRVASLLEVGTGFHPELTGRENIYLNGAILGMTKKEIHSKFDDIVDFGEIEKFIDTPVKRYSSGMYVRLAFAVAAHLDPEILIVDEVLAVGDAAFQKKCLGKMGDVAKGGRTVLFVSHNMGAVEKLCGKTIFLKEGHVMATGDTKAVIRNYLENVDEEISTTLAERRERTGRGKIRFKEVSFDNSPFLAIGDDVSILITLENTYEYPVDVRLSLSIRTIKEVPLISCDSRLFDEKITLSDTGENKVRCKLFSPPLNYGDYGINLAVYYKNEPEDWIASAAKFSVVVGNYDKFIETNDFPVLAKFEWFVES